MAVDNEKPQKKPLLFVLRLINNSLACVCQMYASFIQIYWSSMDSQFGFSSIYYDYHSRLHTTWDGWLSDVQVE